jgi:hypothetical protein
VVVWWGEAASLGGEERARRSPPRTGAKLDGTVVFT